MKYIFKGSIFHRYVRLPDGDPEGTSLVLQDFSPQVLDRSEIRLHNMTGRKQKKNDKNPNQRNPLDCGFFLFGMFWISLLWLLLILLMVQKSCDHQLTWYISHYLQGFIHARSHYHRHYYILLWRWWWWWRRPMSWQSLKLLLPKKSSY